jgi:hypothetical protein
MTTTDELNEIYKFVEDFRTGGSEAIPELEMQLRLAIGYGQRVGELLNEAERAYRLKCAESLNRLQGDDEETETTRRAKLEAWTSEEKYVWANLRTMFGTLKSIRMSLFQQVKTRRDEMGMR